MRDSTPFRRARYGAGWRSRSLLVPLLLVLCALGRQNPAHAGREYDPFDAEPAAYAEPAAHAEPSAYNPFEHVTPPASANGRSSAARAGASHPMPRPKVSPHQIKRRVSPSAQATANREPSRVPPAAVKARQQGARVLRHSPLARQVTFQTAPLETPAEARPQPQAAKDPCAAATEKPLAELGIDIGLPSGEVPDDHAAVCWDKLPYADQGLPMVRPWAASCYEWDATCFAHRPLYFEEINLERYGYGCYACLQPAVSAAHFFGTVPALPYCIAAECPGECVYTLGHYRPGSCPPWRHHWPPYEPLAAAAEAGVLTGLIFLIP